MLHVRDDEGHEIVDFVEDEIPLGGLSGVFVLVERESRGRSRRLILSRLLQGAALVLTLLGAFVGALLSIDESRFTAWGVYALLPAALSLIAASLVLGLQTRAIIKSRRSRWLVWDPSVRQMHAELVRQRHRLAEGLLLQTGAGGQAR